MNRTLRELCKAYTDLPEEDIEVLERLASQLLFFTDMTGNDIFIDTVTNNGIDSVVLAWSGPVAESLYRTSVVGQLTYSSNEPAVFHTSISGEISRDVRGVNQEGVPISQTVVPIKNLKGKIIGVLIRERDISKELRQEEQVQLLSHTAERLSNTLIHLSMTEATSEDWLGNGIFILDKYGKITYANKSATKMYQGYCNSEALGRDFLQMFPNLKNQPISLNSLLAYLKDTELDLYQKSYHFRAHPLIARGDLNGCAISVQDVTDLREKEKELNAKSIIIREIHHRVKNNLQNIAALLGLQMRRSNDEYVKKEFAACINRIMAIALVHDVSACSQWESIDLTELSERILNSVMEHALMPDHNIEARVDGEKILLPGQQSVSLAIVINELLSNALKHGVGPQGKGKIVIKIEEQDNLISLSVIDNGPKSPDMFNQVSNRHLGLQIVDSLVREQLGGWFRLERIREMTQATVYLPKRDGEVGI